MDFKVESNVPVAPKGRSSGRPTKYPFAQMNVGDSFAFPVRLRKKISSAATAHARQYNQRFTIRAVSDDVARCWRTDKR